MTKVPVPEALDRRCHDCAPSVMAIASTLGFFAVLTFLCFANVPAENARIVQSMTGLLGGGWTSIVAYFFGSRKHR